MPALSAYASVLCTIAALSNAQPPHFHQWNHYGPPGAVSPTSAASTISAASPASSSTASVAVVELDGSSEASSVVRSSASSTTSSSGSVTAATSSSSITPKGLKAGIAGFPGIQVTNAAILDQFASYISWYSDYWPNTTDYTGNGSTLTGIGMLWGNGDLNETDPTITNETLIAEAATGDTDRYNEYGTLTASSTPTYMMGFYEPDWQGPYSSNMNPQTAATAWTSTLGKLDKTLIGSPSMATQLNEQWLEPFMEALGVTEPPWDYTCIHTNKNTSQGVMDDVGYYWTKYQKPVWVSEFACVNDQSADWSTCDQETTYTFIKEVVEFFESNSTVIAYGYSNGAGLGSVWPLINDETEELTPSGQCYLNVLSGMPCTSA